MTRPVALVTGASRMRGIGAALALRLAEDGWDVATSHWVPYDDRMPWGREQEALTEMADRITGAGARHVAVAADLADPAEPARLFDEVEAALGPVTALVMSHAESVDSDIRDTTVESFDRHFAVNARASWLLVRELATRFRGPAGRGRIVALTSDAVVRNMPYGASKGALDRIVLAAARELADLRVSANLVNPGPVDTGWMSEELRSHIEELTPLGRGGRPSDAAALVSFLCSEEGGWINGQLLNADGGLHA
jgi:3-oxoacyl-[acyl-carrier protein] reductase